MPRRRKFPNMREEGWRGVATPRARVSASKLQPAVKDLSGPSGNSDVTTSPSAGSLHWATAQGSG